MLCVSAWCSSGHASARCISQTDHTSSIVNYLNVINNGLTQWHAPMMSLSPKNPGFRPLGATNSKLKFAMDCWRTDALTEILLPGQALTTRAGLLLYGNQRAKLGPFAKPCHTSSICTLLGNLHFIQSWADSKIARRRRIFLRILGWQNTIL